ncbi:hypothetical protein ISN45_At05g058670 [Arabidopsis thaliana x Arabidopsis arenosa]|uniref:Microtubule-associated futsch-like protein n=2 Tax=Arabidopsis TaxID=3701 RepID=A0A178U9J9_ARATH|nr:hypothetical protein ISN45_At05g058670 [Arabidopsis thaliana x Arabidopsis arenosa]OAO90305.1 hypothetical protein AXX17_AT5G62070 [Arabidopsis thaliana]
MEKSMEKSVSSAASGNSINSKLRYPLRSALRSKEGKPPVPDFSASSMPRRARVVSAVSQSTTVLDLSGKKSVDRTKLPPRRLSIPNKPTSNSSVKSVSSSVTSLSEVKPKRSRIVPRSFNETTPPVSSNLRSSVTRKKVEDLSSSTYWLTHIKLAESVAKHSISLGFFKLALHAGCEPLDKMKEELKLYARRNNMDGLADAMKELSELYNISEESNQVQVSETSSVVAEETAMSLNNDNDVQSSFSTPGNSNITSEITKDDALQDSTVTKTTKEKDALQDSSVTETTKEKDALQDSSVTETFKEEGALQDSSVTETTKEEDALQDSSVTETTKEEQALETVTQGRTRKSLEVINVNQENVSEVVQESEEGLRPSADGVQIVTVVKPSDKKRARKETVPKNNLPVRTKKSLATNSANSKTVQVNKDDKSQKKSERITKPRTKRVQEESKKSIKKSTAKEGEVKSLKQTEKMENKENTVVVGAGEDIQV